MGAGFCMVLNTIGKCLVWSWALERRTWHQFELEELERVEGLKMELRFVSRAGSSFVHTMGFLVGVG